MTRKIVIYEEKNGFFKWQYKYAKPYKRYFCFKIKDLLYEMYVYYMHRNNYYVVKKIQTHCLEIYIKELQKIIMKNVDIYP